MQVYYVGVTVGLHIRGLSGVMDSSWKFGKEMQNQ